MRVCKPLVDPRGEPEKTCRTIELGLVSQRVRGSDFSYREDRNRLTPLVSLVRIKEVATDTH